MDKVFVKKDKRSELEKEYENAVKLLKTESPGSDGYRAQLDVVERLHTMLMDEKDRKRTVSPDAIVTGCVGLLQVGGILCHERLHNITTKAMNFVFKGRVR